MAGEHPGTSHHSNPPMLKSTSSSSSPTSVSSGGGSEIQSKVIEEHLAKRRHSHLRPRRPSSNGRRKSQLEKTAPEKKQPDKLEIHQTKQDEQERRENLHPSALRSSNSKVLNPALRQKPRRSSSFPEKKQTPQVPKPSSSFRAPSRSCRFSSLTPISETSRSAPPPQNEQKLNDRRRMLLQASGRPINLQQRPSGRTLSFAQQQEPTSSSSPTTGEERDRDREEEDGWHTRRGMLSQAKSQRLLMAFSRRNLFAEDESSSSSGEDDDDDEEKEEKDSDDDEESLGDFTDDIHWEKLSVDTTRNNTNNPPPPEAVDVVPALKKCAPKKTAPVKRPPNKNAKASFVRYCKVHGAPQEIVAYNNTHHYHYGPGAHGGLFGMLSKFPKALQQQQRPTTSSSITEQQQQQQEQNIDVNWLEHYLYSEQPNNTGTCHRHPFWPLVQTLSFQRRDVLEVALDDTLFHSLQDGLRKRGVVTHNYLRENIHFYIQLHKQQKGSLQ